MQVSINGETRHFDTPLTLTALVAQMDLGGRRIAIERNGEIVPRSRHGETLLDEGDRIEIVVAVGGG